ncbi:hypothetical protein [Streptomyces sp. Inha503]|uniref:hypothetical protein n=1 Tax=Streptomyces sp. Inha503 TaxID=3383314 RepID=UPI0039A3324F
MARLERHVKDLVASHATAEGRKILHRYPTWHLIRRLRQRSHGKETTHHQLAGARQHLRAAVNLPDWLEEQNLTVATRRQADRERWTTSDDVRHRQEAGHFVRRALSQKIARDLSFPAVRWNGPTQGMDDEARWDTARRLLHDDTIRPEDRLADLLLLLHTQWPAAVPARPLGIDITVAVKWQRAAAGDWAAHTAVISQRATRHLQGEDVHAPR